MEAAATVAGASLLAERTVPFARHLGGLASYNNSTTREVERRKAAMRAGWSRLGSFWTARARRTTKRAALLSVAVEAGMSGLTAFTPTLRQLQGLTGILCSYLRVLEAGKAFTAAPNRDKSTTKGSSREAGVGCATLQ